MVTPRSGFLNVRTSSIFFLTLIVIACSFSAVSAQCPGEALTFGLQGPNKLIQTQQGNLIVAETGTEAPNSGRVSIVGLNGNRRSLLEGLPSGISSIGDPSGTNGVFLHGRTLYVLNGEGDATIPGPGPAPTELPNPSPNSPILSSILAVHFSAAVEKNTIGFVLTLADHQALKDGEKLTFNNGGGDKITVELVADFPDYVPDPLPSSATVRHANPFGITGIGNELYVSDGGRNLVYKVDAGTGAFSILASFPPLANSVPPPTGNRGCTRQYSRIQRTAIRHPVAWISFCARPGGCGESRSKFRSSNAVYHRIGFSD